MAYGKIKADTLVYDNSGTDTDVTIASLGAKADLNSPTFTGTVTIPTPSSGDNSTKAASTAFVVAGFTAKPASAGTVAASEVVQVDANKDTTGIRNLTISGNLQVNGTTTTVASSTMTVADKNIELAKGAANDAAADGGGITLESGDGNKTITWENSTNRWNFNQDICVTSGAIRIRGAEGADAHLYITADEADDNADYWRIKNAASDNTLTFANYTTGGYTTTLKLNPNGAVEDSKGDVRKIPQNQQSSGYTLVGADSGKHVLASGQVFVNNNVFAAGDAITLINASGIDRTITQGSGLTMYNAADGSTGDRTYSSKGMATILFTDTSTCYISGAGLS